jgi:cation transport regulator ChaC
MDAICDSATSPLNNFYFAYGSNLLQSELLRTCADAEYVGKAFLPGYRLTFSKHSVTRKGDAASIEIDPCRMTWGVIYRMNNGDKEALKKREGGYKEIAVEAYLIDEEDVTPQRAFTFVGEVICTKNCGPTDEYLAIVIRGASSRGLSEGYCEQIKTEFATKGI